MKNTTEDQRKRRREADAEDEEICKRIRSNSNRSILIGREMMQQAEQRKFVESWWSRLRRICLICFLLDEDYEDHRTGSCPIMEEEFKKVKIRDWKKKKIEIGYSAGTCCYKCSRPSDMCSMAEFGLSSSCMESDMIMPVTLIGWIRTDMNVKGIMEEIAERELKDVEDAFRCMMRKHYERTLSHWGSKGFAAWVRIIWMNREKLERELNESEDEDERESEGEDESENERRIREDFYFSESEEDLYV